jgi:hypothetical protein
MVSTLLSLCIWTYHFKFGPSKNTDLRYNLYGQRVLKMMKFTHVYVLSNRTLLFVREVCTSGQKCSEIKVGQVTQHHNSGWDSQSPIYEHYLWVRHRCGITVTNVRYFNILWNKLPSPICTDQRGKLSQAVLLLHKNAHRHTAGHIMTTLPMLNWNILNNPAYRSDLMTSSGWTHKGGSERLKIHRSWHNEGCRALLFSHTAKNLIIWCL